jgi:hypothetical protein
MTIKKLTLDWLSDGSGDVTGSTDAVIEGVIIRASFTPDGGATAPSDLYDVYIYEYGTTIDLLGGAGVDLSNTTAETVIPLIPDKDALLAMGPAIANRLTYVVDNAGAAKGGIIDLYYR